jgi:soluble lytic murein transglycosylase-like protein
MVPRGPWVKGPRTSTLLLESVPASARFPRAPNRSKVKVRGQRAMRAIFFKTRTRAALPHARLARPDGAAGEQPMTTMKARLLGFGLVLGLLYGCSDGGFLPYAPHAMNAGQLNALIANASRANNVPQGLVRAVLMAESAGDPGAVSSAGAQGLMQLMPGTASGCGISNAFDPQQNVACGTSYLHGLLVRYHNDTSLAVAAYNAGPGAVDAYHGIPPYAETQAYVYRVLSAYRNY